MKSREIHFFTHTKDRYLLQTELLWEAELWRGSITLKHKTQESPEIRSKRRAPQKTGGEEESGKGQFIFGYD